MPGMRESGPIRDPSTMSACSSIAARHIGAKYDRVAGPIGIEKREKIALTPLPAFLDGRPVSPVFLEHDDVHVAEALGRILCKFCGAIRRSVAHHENLDGVQARRSGNLPAGPYAAQECFGDRPLFVQGRDHDGQAAHDRTAADRRSLG